MRFKERCIALLCVLVLLAGVLSGCGAKNNPAPDTANEPTGTAPDGTVTGDKDTDKQIVLKMVDWSDSTKTRRDEFNAKYMQEHPNVKIEYTVMTIDQFKSSVVSLVQSGDAPDLFPVPTGMNLATAVNENWFAPLDDLFSDDFKATLDEGIFSEGVSLVGGKLYSLPEQQALTNALIFYNKDLLAAADVDVPKTYSEFIDACKKVTEAGKGRYYGFIEGGKQINRLDTLIRSWVQVAGGKIAPSGYALTVNGNAPYDSKELNDVFGVFAQLYKDGSIHPDTMNITAPEARELFAQGQAAFLTQGSWCISTWAQSNPELNYGVMAIPSPDGKTPGYIGNGEPGPWVGIYSQSKNKEAAAEYLQALYSEDYQGAIVGDGGYISIVKGINEKYMTNEIQKQYYDIAVQTTVLAPIASKADNKVFDFYTEVKDVSPNLGSLFQGVISGGIEDYAAELKTLADKSTQEWKRAAAQVGLDYSAFEFPNWDPAKSYTAEDYSAK